MQGGGVIRRCHGRYLTIGTPDCVLRRTALAEVGLEQTVQVTVMQALSNVKFFELLQKLLTPEQSDPCRQTHSRLRVVLHEVTRAACTVREIAG